ncbi:MAG: hypothetical protein U0929_15195 [Planctomycetaceae bacterium]
MKYEIKALSLGEILDQGIKLIRDKFGLLMGIMVFTVIPAQIAIALFTNQFQPVPGQPPQLPSSSTILIQLGLVYGFILIVLPLANAAVVYTTARTYLGQDASLGDSFGHAIRRLPALIWTSILMGLAVFGGMILLIIPGIIFAFWFMLSQQVAVLEPLNGAPALSRSKALMKGNIGTAMVLGFVIGIINFSLGAACGMLPAPFNAIATGVVAGVTTLVSTCTFVVFYFSCRCKLDNFDLEVLANEVGASDDDGSSKLAEE